MTRHGISIALGSLLLGFLLALNTPAVSAREPDAVKSSVASAGRDFTTQQAMELDALTATTPGMTTAASNGQWESDMILTALEMANSTSTIPVAVSLTGPVTEHARG